MAKFNEEFIKKIPTTPRENWQTLAHSVGFNFHTMYGQPYWDESAYYEIDYHALETHLEDPTIDMISLLDWAVNKVLSDDDLMRKFQIPEQHWEYVRNSYHNGDETLYGRIDYSWYGDGPAKFLEFNADTPTSLYESAAWQWKWFEDSNFDPDRCDQFNSVEDALVDRLERMKSTRASKGKPTHLHLACCKDTIEDLGTVQYIAECAEEAGITTSIIYIDDIGVNEDWQLVDPVNEPIHWMFKLYPWEFMLREEFSQYLGHTDTDFIEPAWKSILSNKALLPLLYKMAPNHPNILEAYFEDEWGPEAHAGRKFVKKPIFSREGANITFINEDLTIGEQSDGEYGEEGFIYQLAHELPKVGDSYTLFGCWVVGGLVCGLSVREDSTLITKDMSRFIPHIITYKG